MHSSVARPAFPSRSQASRGGPRQSSPTLFILSLATKAAGALSVSSIFVAFSKKRMGCVMNNAIRVCLLISVFCIANHAEGGVEGKLPDNVRPLTANEVVNIYSGKTIDYPGFKYYFEPDGHLVGYTKNMKSIASGDWRVEDNQICIRSVWRNNDSGQTAIYRSCNAWYSDGTAYWTKITRGGLAGNVYKGDGKLVTPGDQVSDVVRKLQTGHQ
jgi:Protein of unknown function (DUF995)